MKNYLSLLVALFTYAAGSAQSPATATVPARWNLASSQAIAWQVKDRVPHADHIEMSGQKFHSGCSTR